MKTSIMILFSAICGLIAVILYNSREDKLAIELFTKIALKKVDIL